MIETHAFAHSMAVPLNLAQRYRKARAACVTPMTVGMGRATLVPRELTMNVAAWVQRNGLAFGNRPGISVGTQVHATYAQWAARVRSIAGALAALPGMVPGERVALAMTNRAEYLEALFAVWHAGLFAVPINAKLHREEFRHIPGMVPGERVALAMTNRAEYLEALFAVWHAGLFAVPINAKLHREEFRHILGHSGARLAFVSPDLAGTIAPLQGDLPELAQVVVAGDDD